MNPAPRPVRRVKRDERPPDEKHREVKSRLGASCELLRMNAEAMESAVEPFSSAAEDVDDLEWPEVIYVS
jgi:hypothetical protein